LIKALRNIKEVRQQMTDFTGRLANDCPKEIKDMTEAINKKLTGVEEALHQTKAKSSQDILNFPIRLDDKLSGLYDGIASGNGAPSKQAKEAYAVIGGQIDAELNKLKVILNDDLPKLNQLIHAKSMPVIGIKKEN
jgi:hypothetical protein